MCAMHGAWWSLELTRWLLAFNSASCIVPLVSAHCALCTLCALCVEFRAHEVVACRAGSSVSQASSLQASASPVCTHSVSVHPKLSIWGRTTIVAVLDPEASYYK